MKQILLLTTALFWFHNVQGQDVKKLLGTWEIKKFQYSNDANNNKRDTSFRKYKSYTTTNFIVTKIDNRTNITTTSIFGTYEIKDSIYTEKILSVNLESAEMIGLTFSFTLTFENDDIMSAIGSINGMKTSEIWQRLKNNPKPEQLLQGGTESLFDGEIKRLKVPLCVIKNGDKYISLKSDPKIVLTLIGPKDIESLQVVKNEAALKLLGEPGRNGVLIVVLRAGKLASVLELLKLKGVTAAE
ncbi:MAG: hypothetical protein ACOH2A_05290 [Sphingobacteriaceae bacterium]